MTGMKRNLFFFLGITAGLGLPGGAVTDARALVVSCPSGISATIHTASEIETSWLVRSEGRVFLRHPAVGSLELLTGPDDPRFRREDVTGFEPFAPEIVAEALVEVHGVEPRLDVIVFILPTPPAAVQTSFAQREIIFLSPGFGEVAASTVSYTCAHELGHVLTWAYLDPYPWRWREYLALRGLPVATIGSTEPHANRAREILAEDFRFLFGGRLANVAGSIENHELPSPDQVAGLTDLLSRFCFGSPTVVGSALRSLAFPNPCNPVTTVMLELSAGSSAMAAEVTLTLYDVRGRRVRCISGGRLEGDRVLVRWNGVDDAGRSVASGRYLYTIRWRGLSSQGSVLLVR